MKRHDYPLNAIRKAREADVERAQHSLRDALLEFERRTARMAARRNELERHNAETERERKKHVAMEGPRSAATVQRELAYLDARRVEARSLAEECEKARAAVRSQDETVAEARAQLARAEARAKALDRHRERWDDAREKEELERSDEEAEDLARATQKRD